MTVEKPERTIVRDPRVTDLMFEFIKIDGKFRLDDMLARWFRGNLRTLTSFVNWLDEAGLEIRRKK